MKKFVCLILALILALCFVGCSDNVDRGDDGGGLTGDNPKPNQSIGNLAAVESGESVYSVLIPEDANESIRFSASEMQKWIASATGVSLPVVEDKNYSADKKYISLGRTKLLESLNLNIDYGSLNLDGYVIKTDSGKNVVIDGYRNSGILNGVYGFLDEVAGIKFLTADYTYVPKLTELPLYEMDEVSVPAFQLRDYYAQGTMQDKYYAARMRLNSKYQNVSAIYGENGSNAYFWGDGHTLMDNIVPYNKYGEAHPNWYTKGGNELRYTDGLTEDDEFDPTNTDSLIYNLIELIKQRILDYPDATYFMLGQPDNGAWDDSAEAVASMNRNGGRSGTLMVFLNTIAEQIEKWMEAENIDKDVMFVTFAYWKTIDAPVKKVNDEWVPYNDKVKARDNVAVKVAHMTCTYHSLYDTSCSENIIARTRIEQWSTVTDHLFIWDYCTNFSTDFFWFPHFNSIAKNLKYYIEKGVIEVMAQGAPHVHQYYEAELDGYLWSKLLWNPYLDVNDLIGEFNYYYYGPESSKAIDEFYDLMTFYYASLDSEEKSFHTDLYSVKGFQDFTWYSVGFLEKSTEIVKNEIAAVETREGMSVNERDVLIKKLKKALIHPMFMVLWNYDAYYDATGKKEYAQEFFDICQELGIRYYGEGAGIGDLKTQFGIA